MTENETKKKKSWWRRYWCLPTSIILPFLLAFGNALVRDFCEVAVNQQKSLDYLGKQLTREEDFQILLSCCPSAFYEGLPFGLAGLVIAGSTYLILRKKEDQDQLSE